MTDELAKLKAQRDRAWRALNSIEDALADGVSDPLVLAIPLAASRGPQDCEDWNRLVGTENATADLQAIVDTLPKNGDGKPIALGSKYWAFWDGSWCVVTVWEINATLVSCSFSGLHDEDLEHHFGVDELFSENPAVAAGV